MARLRLFLPTLYLDLTLLALVAAFYLRLGNLDGGHFLDPDEYRALGPINIQTPLFDVIYKVPQMFWGESEETVLKTSATIGFLCSAPLFLLGYLIGGTQIAAAATILFSVVGLQIFYSRSGYPLSLQSFFLLSAWCLLIASLRGRWRRTLSGLSALCLAAAFFCYIPSYAALIATPYLLIALEVQRGAKLQQALLAAAHYGCYMLLAAALIIAGIMYGTLGTVNFAWYMRAVQHFQAETTRFMSAEMISAPLQFLNDVNIHGGLLQYGIVLFAFFAPLALKRARGATPWLLPFTGGCAVLLLLGNQLGFHTLYTRHFVFLLPLVCLLAATALYGLLPRSVAEFATLGFFVVGALICGRISEHQFKTSPMTTWFLEKQIRAPQIATLFEFEMNGETTITLPGNFNSYPDGDFQIDWKNVEARYRAGSLRYVLTSGLGSASAVGYKDEKLASVTPLTTWPHPYRQRGENGARLQDFKLYDLNTIFQ